MRGRHGQVLRAGALLLGLVVVGAAVAMIGSRDAEATPPKSLRVETPLPTPPPGSPGDPMPTPPPLSAPAPREETHAPPPSRDEGTACGRTFHPPFDGHLARRAAYRGARPKAFMYCPSWSGFGTVRGGHRFHGGVDVAAPTGTAVRAATSGTLTYAHDPGGYGLFARVRFAHPKRSQGTCEGTMDVEILYAHLAEGSQKGAKTPRQVRAGDVIGHVGCTGNARGMCSPSPESHLHVTVQRADGDRRWR